MSLTIRPVAPPARLVPGQAPAEPPPRWRIDGGFGGTVLRPALYSRNGVTWTAVRAWGATSKASDMETLKVAKAAATSELVDYAADEIAALVMRACPGVFGEIVPVACGHSRRSDCFGDRLAEQVAERIGATLTRVFAHRFVSGVSHPKEFAKLPPLEVLTPPASGRVLIVDDVATSGWHMEEATLRLREMGVGTGGVTWIGGNLST